MTNQEFLELFCQSATMLLEETVQDLLEEDARYQQIQQEEEEAEQQYLQLDLTEKQRAVIEDMLLQKERSTLRYAEACYLAGIRNVMQLEKVLKL